MHTSGEEPPPPGMPRPACNPCAAHPLTRLPVCRVSLTMELQSACDQLQVEQERSTMLQAGLTANEATVRALNRRLEAADLTLQEDGIRTKRCYDEIQGLSDTFQAKLRGLIDNSWHKKCRQGEAMDACLDVCNK